MAGRVYACALCVSVAAVATGASPFIAQLFGMDLGPTITTMIAIGLVAMSTALNLSGTRWLARVAMFGFICELVWALAVGA
jgi:amino acid transporter